MELLHAADAKYRALVTDNNLGRDTLDGWEVARHAREIDPAFPVVYMSGDSSDDWGSKGVPKHHVGETVRTGTTCHRCFSASQCQPANGTRLAEGRLSWRPLSYQTKRAMSRVGTFETCRLTLGMSVNGGRPEVISRRSNRR